VQKARKLTGLRAFFALKAPLRGPGSILTFAGKGGGGVFLREIPSMLLMVLML
jgi:hypothetical protein